MALVTDLCGTWDMISNDNDVGYMKALGINSATRKIAHMMKPQKRIQQVGDSFTIETLCSFRNISMSFTIGKEEKEITKGIDNRSCQTLVNWDNGKLVCVQKGEKKNRGWTYWIQGDELHMVCTCEDQVCKQVFKKSA